MSIAEKEISLSSFLPMVFVPLRALRALRLRKWADQIHEMRERVLSE
jgi:hypothetical protein